VHRRRILADDSGIGNDADLFEEPLGALASLRIDAEFVAEVGREDGRSLDSRRLREEHAITGFGPGSRDEPIGRPHRRQGK